jgi:p-hydroxybenzoate 3-monooxygenase
VSFVVLERQEADGLRTRAKAGMTEYRGAGSALFPGTAAVSAAYPTRWLALIAAAPPSAAGTIYGLHTPGFAGQIQRSAAMTRFMLEVSAGEGYG